MLSLVLIGLGAAAAILLPGCSNNKKKSTDSTPDRYIPPHDLAYDKKCIFDSKCKPQHRIAAAYDYVGMVYGEKGKQQYNSFLTLDETIYVETNFGRILEPKDISALLSKAQEVSLEKFLTYSNKACSWPTFLHGKNSQWGEGFIFGGTHNCFDQYRKDFSKTGLEQSIASNPEDWVFLIETSKAVEIAMAEGIFPQDEMALFYQVANRLGIPLENPLIPIDSEPVIALLEKEGISRIRFAAFLLIGHLTRRIYSHPTNHSRLSSLTPEQVDEFLHTNLEKYLVTREKSSSMPKEQAKTLGVELDGLYKIWKDFIPQQTGETRAEAYHRISSETARIGKRALFFSNKLSVTHIREMLQKHKKPKAFIQMGRLHLPIVREVYGDVSEITKIPNFF